MKALIVVLCCAFVVYVATYFISQTLPVRIRVGGATIAAKYLEINGEKIPDYHGIPESIFSPLHYLDRRLMRPAYWRPHLRNEELSFKWLEEKSQ